MYKARPPWSNSSQLPASIASKHEESLEQSICSQILVTCFIHGQSIDVFEVRKPPTWTVRRGRNPRNLSLKYVEGARCSVRCTGSTTHGHGASYCPDSQPEKVVCAHHALTLTIHILAGTTHVICGRKCFGNLGLWGAPSFRHVAENSLTQGLSAEALQ